VISEWLAGGIAPDRFLAYEGVSQKSPVPDVLMGVPPAVHDSKAQKNLLAVWGIEL
jgi:hypothetical protein